MTTERFIVSYTNKGDYIMRIETKTELKEITTIRYIAEDGKEFNVRESCEFYELKQRRALYKKENREKHLSELEGMYPLSVKGQVFSDDEYAYSWYKLKSESDFEILESMYKEAVRPDVYPEIICVEQDKFQEDNYFYKLSDMKKDTVEFWKNFGFEIKFLED